MKQLKLLFVITSITFIVISCKQKETIEKPAHLKDVFKNDFYIGAALNEFQFNEKDSTETAIIKNEFSSITAENMMKSMHIHPQKDTFNFTEPDKFIDFGLKNNQFIVGHTLIWHSQLAPWIAEIKDSTEMAEFIKNHIQTIVGRYKGKVNSWDVVNEALNEDGTYRETVFYNALGEDYIALAFNTVAETDPETELYYNDYNMADPAKREGAIKLIKSLQEKGVKIDGIGMQGHWGLNYPELSEIDKSLTEYAKLGVKISITELDITVLPNPWEIHGADVNMSFEANEKLNPYPTQLPDSINDQLAERYKAIFKLFLKHKNNISRITFWGVHNKQSWLNNWPVKGRTNYPLLFDRQLKPKKAYHTIIELKQSENEN